MHPVRIRAGQWGTAGPANLPEYHISVHEQRADGTSVRSGGVRLFLHPAPEPDK